MYDMFALGSWLQEAPQGDDGACYPVPRTVLQDIVSAEKGMSRRPHLICTISSFRTLSHTTTVHAASAHDMHDQRCGVVQQHSAADHNQRAAWTMQQDSTMACKAVPCVEGRLCQLPCKLGLGPPAKASCSFPHPLGACFNSIAQQLHQAIVNTYRRPCQPTKDAGDHQK